MEHGAREGGEDVDEEAIRILEAEKAWLKEQLPSLLSERAGQWVVVKEQKIHGFFPDNGAAYAAGIAQFGAEAVFLVAPVQADFDAPVDMPALRTGLLYAHL